MRHVSRKWRPRLRTVVAGILLAVMALPLVGLFFFRLYENQLVRQPEAELIAQGSVIALAATAVLGGTLIIGLVFLRAIGRPIGELTLRTARIAAGDRDAVRPLDHHGTREIAELADAFLDMARKLQARSEAIQTFATHVSHELKSPLTAIQGAAELLRDAGNDMDPATKRRFYDNIVADADRMNRLVRRLIELAQSESANPTGESTSLTEASQLATTGDGAAVTVGEGGDLRFGMSPESMAIVLSNLIDNSTRHGARHVRLSATERGDTVSIVASDDGAGISIANRGRLFEPFFTTRRESGGTGVGLSIVAALVRAHGGTIRLAHSNIGARFEIGLPKTRSADL